MPPIISGQSKDNVDQTKYANVVTIAKNKPYDYDYKAITGIKDLRPGSKTHDKLRDAILARARASRNAVQCRFTNWQKIDEMLTSYVPIDEEEKAVKEKDPRKPVSIIIPVSFAILDTFLTYYSAAFLEEPYFGYEGVGPEDVVGAKKLELSVAHQCRRAKVGLEMHTMWRGGLSYGYEAVYVGYENRQGYRMVEEEESIYSRLMGAFRKTGRMDNRRELVNVFSGNTLTALDPYKCLPDPDVPIHRVQDMSFFGWVDRTNYMNLLELERDNDSEYFNVKYIQHIKGTSIYNKDETDTGRHNKFGYTKDENTSGTTKIVDIMPMFVKLIPSDWGLSDNDYPEIYVFELAADSIIIRAQPLGLDHNMIPVAINAPDYDGHGITPTSRLEMIYGMQETLDWMYKSHMTNVRKAINDMLIVDPQVINIHDLMNPEPGKLIRMRRGAWNRGIKDAVMQLPVNDVTRNNIGDTNVLRDWANNVSGAQDAVQGMRRRTSERVSATEAAGTMRAALSRLEKIARITSMQAHYDIAYQMAWNTRQLMDEETYYKILGDWDKVLSEEAGVDRERVKVSPKDLDIDFDITPHDGTVPGSGDPSTWLEIYKAVAQNPLLAQNLDMVKLFKYGARLAGAKNINDFVLKGGNIQPQIMPDEQVAAQMQQGNIVPASVQNMNEREA